MPNLAGKYAVASFEGLKDVLDKFQVPQEKRDPAKIQGATVDIQQNGDNFSITTTGGLGKSGTTTFSVGGAYETEIFGKTLKGTTAWEGEALVMRGEGGAVLRREISGGQLVYTVEFQGSTAKILFNRA